MEQLPKVTVGVINYNYGHFLEECIQSILSQTYPNIEVMIIDDYSTDGSIETIKTYEREYQHVRAIYHEQNSGNPVKAIQEIIALATGDYFMIVSADDSLNEQDAVEIYVKEMVDNPELDYVYGNLQLIDTNSTKKGLWTYINYQPDDVVYFIFQRGGSGVIPMSAGLHKIDFYKKRSILWHHNGDFPIGEDTLNCLINIKEGWKFKHIDVALKTYRHHEENVSHNFAIRIPSTVNILTFIMNQFSETVYFRNIVWEKVIAEHRADYLNYLIGDFYWKQFKMNFHRVTNTLGRKVSHARSEKIDILKPLLKESLEYLNKCIGGESLYKNLALNLKKEIEQFIQI